MYAYTDNIGIDVTYISFRKFSISVWPPNAIYRALFRTRLKFLRAWNKRSNYVPSNGNPWLF